MKDLLWSKPIPKTIVLAISPVLIGLLGNIVVSSPTILWIVLTGILFLLYILYLIGNANYESKQKHHETWHDAITSLCREDCTQIRTYADSIHQKVNSKVGHAEITDWEKVQSYCNSICRIVYNFIQEIAHCGNQFSVSVFFKRSNNGILEYNMLSRVSYDRHNPASYNTFRSEEDVKFFHFKKLFDKCITRASILPTKDAIRAAFTDCDGVNYSQYIGIPVACTGNKMIAILQIVSYNDSIIASSEKEIQELVDNYLSTYANLILLADKTENAIHYL